MSLDHYIEKEDFQTKRLSFQILKKVIADLSHEKRVFFTGLFFLLLATMASLSEPRVLGWVIDKAIVPKDFDVLFQLAVLFFGLTIIRVCAQILSAYVFERLAQNMMQRLRLKVFAHLQALPISTYDTTPVGRLIVRITNDTSNMSEMFNSGFINLFGNMLFVVGTLGFLFALNFKLAAIACSVLPVLLYFSILFSRRLVQAFRESRMRMSSLNAFLSENILGMKIVHLFNKAKMHFHRFNEVNQSYAQSQISVVRVYAMFQPLITICTGIAVAMVLVMGGKQTLDGYLSQGDLVAFITYLLALFQPIRDIVDKWAIFLSGMTSAERLYQTLDWKTEMTVDRSTESVASDLKLNGEIVFENVWFAYEGENWVLKDFNIKINAGEKIGIVGHTGAGKTTLIGLLLRFYEPQKGKIWIDGKEIRSYDKRALRSRIGLIQQDVFLFSGQLQENIHLWASDSLKQNTIQTIEDLGLKQDVSHGLDERGANLSMGEKQVIAFTRVLEKTPDLWILDEATANVDSDTEVKLETALKNATQGKTLITIAHRLATIKNADRILVLHHGKLIEQGNHVELLKQNGAYSKLYQYQKALDFSHSVF